MQRILVFDNYDSFTYNLVQMLVEAAPVQVDVLRNDGVVLDELEVYDRIVLSPGPGIPQEAGQLLQVVQRYTGRKPMLGVCLGHQAIGIACGGELHQLAQVRHGVASTVHVQAGEGGLFGGLPKQFAAGRYHSWAVTERTLPPELRVTARDGEGTIMAMAHTHHPLVGVQFHPESVLTEHGAHMLSNFLSVAA
jgi:anthranilate synthase component II